MFTKIYWLHTFNNGARLGIMPRPRGGEWLDKEIANLKKLSAGVIVSLLESSEIFELGLDKEQELCAQHDIDYINFPISDRSVPADRAGVDALIKQLRDKIAVGASVVIHCRMGIGRSSIIAGCLLLREGQRPDDIIAHISKVRGLKVPDTEEQVKWLQGRR